MPLLPSDIVVLDVKQVSDAFHARFDAKGRNIGIMITRETLRDPFKRNYTYHYPYPLNLTCNT